MKTVTVRGVEIGTGRPKIAASITGADRAAVLAQAQALKALPVEIAEWRMDCFSSGEELTDVLDGLRRVLGPMPLLATYRTRREGGKGDAAAEEYLAVNEAVLAAGGVDLLDVELFSGEETVSRLIAAAHRAGVAVVASSHDFEKTPEKGEMLRRLRRMEELGADLLKLAVMPRTRRDVLTLLEVTETLHSGGVRRPLITMSMGRLGALTRVCGGVFGSAVTFGAASEASAPGQLDVTELARMLALLQPEEA